MRKKKYVRNSEPKIQRSIIQRRAIKAREDSNNDVDCVKLCHNIRYDREKSMFGVINYN